MVRENKTCLYKGWQQMPTEDLDQILQAELEKEYPSEEVVLSILYELEERAENRPVENTPEVLDILEKLNKYQTPSKQSKRKRRWTVGVAAAVAVACLVVMTMSPIAQAESFFDVLVRWTSSIFEFVNPDKGEIYPNVGNEFITHNPGLQKLYDKITSLGITDPVVPMWLPEGFILSTLEERTLLGGKSVHSNFENGKYAVLLTYRVVTEVPPKVEKEETDCEVFEFGGVSHFIVENKDNLSVTWMVEGMECVINANISKEDIYSIIKSIYRSELT